MSEKAVITWSQAADIAASTDIGIYLHWNGDPFSVVHFLAYCKLHGFREPDASGYGYANLCLVLACYFGDGLNVGIERCCNLDCQNGDYGTYVCRGWDIVDHLYADGEEGVVKPDLIQLLEIDGTLPQGMQLGKEKLAALYEKAYGTAQKAFRCSWSERIRQV